MELTEFLNRTAEAIRQLNDNLIVIREDQKKLVSRLNQMEKVFHELPQASASPAVPSLDPVASFSSAVPDIEKPLEKAFAVPSVPKEKEASLDDLEGLGDLDDLQDEASIATEKVEEKELDGLDDLGGLDDLESSSEPVPEIVEAPAASPAPAVAATEKSDDLDLDDLQLDDLEIEEAPAEEKQASEEVVETEASGDDDDLMDFSADELEDLLKDS